MKLAILTMAVISILLISGCSKLEPSANIEGSDGVVEELSEENEPINQEEPDEIELNFEDTIGAFNLWSLHIETRDKQSDITVDFDINANNDIDITFFASKEDIDTYIQNPQEAVTIYENCKLIRKKEVTGTCVVKSGTMISVESKESSVDFNLKLNIHQENINFVENEVYYPSYAVGYRSGEKEGEAGSSEPEDTMNVVQFFSWLEAKGHSYRILAEGIEVDVNGEKLLFQSGSDINDMKESILDAEERQASEES